MMLLAMGRVVVDDPLGLTIIPNHSDLIEQERRLLAWDRFTDLKTFMTTFVFIYLILFNYIIFI